MIRFRCPNCDSQMEVDESFAGRPARCPTCGTTLKVPAEDASHARAAPGAGPRPGAARVTISGEDVDVVPPLETMVIVSMVFVGLAVAVFLLAGLTKFVTPPWAVGALFGALLALLGVIVAVPTYHTIRRSKGRRRGRTHAVISMLTGGGLFLIFLVIMFIGFGREWMRPSCDENLKRIYNALRAYAGDHGGGFPSDLETLAKDKYLDGTKWLTCPACKVPPGETTYALRPEINIQAKRPDGQPWWPTDTMIVWDGVPDAHQDRNVRVLLLSGEVKHVPYGEWTAYQQRQNDLWSRTVMEIREARRQKPAPPPKPQTTPKPKVQEPGKRGASAGGSRQETGP